MLTWLNFVALKLAIVVAAYKLIPVGGRRRTGGTRYLSAFFLCIGLGLAVMAHPVLVAISRVEPVPNLGRLLGNALEMLAAYFLGALGQSIARPAETRRWLRRHVVLLAGATVLMGVLLVSADTTFTLNFVNVYSQDPMVVAYLVVFFSYIAVCLVTFIASVGGYVRHAAAGVLRTGLSLVVAGSALGIVWAAWSGVRPVVTLVTGRSLATSLPIGSTLGSVCMLLWLIGATLTAWGDRITAPLRWLRALRQLRRIEPLWQALRAAMPHIALDTGGGWPFPRAEFALYRRVIEVRDAQLTLRPYAHPDVSRWLGPAADPATVEAAVIAAALVGHAQGRNYRVEHPFQDVDASLASESAWLAQVARQFVGSAEVERVRRLAAAEADRADV
ncbi:MAB_1171c family putative transporter [Micromonospora sp. RTGN7]|uniref:MAB_1171c family putative transporter n=1 Tax=Micromonospora sp. RTGN7 TaxID=3016526 RepID=UPI0029FF41E4|nr:MAB_1171c family putative transporter [Micromonospora sp. RTGN7]